MTAPDNDDGSAPGPMALQITEAEMVKALGHPYRLRIAQMLRTGPRSVTELMEEIGSAPSTMSTYLAVLRRAGLVSTYRVDGAIVYQLSEPSVHGLIQAIRVCLTDVARRSTLVTEALHLPPSDLGAGRRDAGTDPRS